jgi:hypothetical protein
MVPGKQLQISEFPLDIGDLGVIPAKSLSEEAGKKLMKRASQIRFLSGFGASSIENMEVQLLSVETRFGFDATLHPGGSFHMEFSGIPLKRLELAEKMLKTVCSMVKSCAKRDVKFNLRFNSHSDLKEKKHLASSRRIIETIRTESPLRQLRDAAFPYQVAYLVRDVRYGMIGFSSDFVNLQLTLESISPKDMKPKYLMSPLTKLVGLTLQELE